jgi:NAD-dependent SIR2 family protein deacetylase
MSHHIDPQDPSLDRAAEAIDAADTLMIGAGAGMSVDSGLPDFRGDEGFWTHYPPFEQRGLDFYDLANPRWFDRDPELAWGFYGHRLNLYRSTDPHKGFDILRDVAAALPEPPFVFTSNVDGHFQKAEFNSQRVLECHGSIHHLQCSRPCGHQIWSADTLDIEVDPESFRARGDLPRCPHCEAIARPNILMFRDGQWNDGRSAEQQQRFHRWQSRVRNDGLDPVVIEVGAGTAVPTVRMQCERISRTLKGTLIRINPREPEAPDGAISIPAGGLEVLRRIGERLDTIRVET